MLLVIVLLGGAGYWISIHKHEDDEFLRMAEGSMTEFDESSQEVVQELQVPRHAYPMPWLLPDRDRGRVRQRDTQRDRQSAVP